jgi:hypothetical protein
LARWIFVIAAPMTFLFALYGKLELAMPLMNVVGDGDRGSSHFDASLRPMEYQVGSRRTPVAHV